MPNSYSHQRLPSRKDILYKNAIYNDILEEKLVSISKDVQQPIIDDMWRFLAKVRQRLPQDSRRAAACEELFVVLGRATRVQNRQPLPRSVNISNNVPPADSWRTINSMHLNVPP